jgi:hypothetical protein
MSYLELEGDRWIFAVAQKPFLHGINEFCTLAPVVSEDGRRAKPDMFPNSGLVWWLLRSGSRKWAQPGRLVVASLESSPVYVPGDPTKHLYQVQADGISPVGIRDAVEILTVQGGGPLTRPESLVDRAGLFQLDHYPTDSVWVRLGGVIFGPFKTLVTIRSETQFDVSITLPPHNITVQRIPESALASLGTGYYRNVLIEVSRTTSSRSDAVSQSIRYELVVGDAVEQLRGLGEQIELETEDRIIARAAKQVLSRKRRQDLVSLLEELESLVSQSAEVADAAEVVRAVQRRLDANSHAIDEMVDRLFQTRVLDKKLDERIEAAAQAEVARQASYLMAEAEKQSADAQQRLAGLLANLQRVEEELARRRSQAEAGLEEEMNARRLELERGWGEREDRLTEREANLEDRESRIRAALETAAQRLEQNRSDVITDVLTVLPLLTVLQPTQHGAQALPAPPEPRHDDRVHFKLPGFIHGDRSEAYRTPIREAAFFERFVQRVRDVGFAYDADDLIAFHLSVKTSDLTLLSGVSGTGKSSLPRFYMEALQGESAAELDDEVGRYLHVAVRPSWLDQQDLLGHVNTLDHEFVASESGLFPLLTAAAEEYRQRGADSGLYLICLDEMNLAQVEHYFGSFLSALERPANERRIRCFDPTSVAQHSPFRAWSQLPLPASLHFIGTVNYDETTRPLSLRFLDRSDEIELATQDFHTLRAASRAARPETVVVPGRAVTLRDMRSWTRQDPLPPDLASVLDTVREPLRKMRRPLTPRRYEAMTRFVASATNLGDLCPPDKAFDLQLALRLVPQLRSLSSPDARDGLADLLQAFEADGYTERFPRTWFALQAVDETLRPILEIG